VQIIRDKVLPNLKNTKQIELLGKQRETALLFHAVHPMEVKVWQNKIGASWKWRMEK
jgi:hypothetical protein